MTKEEFKKQYNPYGHLGGYTDFSKDLNSVIKDEIEKFVEWYNNEYSTPILPIDKGDIEDYLNKLT